MRSWAGRGFPREIPVEGGREGYSWREEPPKTLMWAASKGVDIYLEREGKGGTPKKSMIM